jgi:hypothetical protein
MNIVMEDEYKFIIGGILVVLSILTGNWSLSFIINPPPGSGFLGPTFFPIVFFVILIIGLKLIADSLIKK